MARRSIRKRVRSGFYGARARYHRARPGFTGVMGSMMAGAVVGVGLRAVSPYINQYVPSVLGLSPTTIAALGGGVAAKSFLHKGGKFADAAIILGSAMAASELMGGVMGGVANGASAGAYANDI